MISNNYVKIPQNSHFFCLHMLGMTVKFALNFEYYCSEGD